MGESYYMEKIREFEIDNVEYHLVAKRSLLIRLKQIVPDLFSIKDEKEIEENQLELGLLMYDNMDVIFYEMIKVKHPNLTKEESDALFAKFCNEYDNAEESLLELMNSVFEQGIPNSKKKKLNWF